MAGRATRPGRPRISAGMLSHARLQPRRPAMTPVRPARDPRAELRDRLQSRAASISPEVRMKCKAFELSSDGQWLKVRLEALKSGSRVTFLEAQSLIQIITDFQDAEDGVETHTVLTLAGMPSSILLEHEGQIAHLKPLYRAPLTLISMVKRARSGSTDLGLLLTDVQSVVNSVCATKAFVAGGANRIKYELYSCLDGVCQCARAASLTLFARVVLPGIVASLSPTGIAITQRLAHASLCKRAESLVSFQRAFSSSLDMLAKAILKAGRLDAMEKPSGSDTDSLIPPHWHRILPENMWSLVQAVSNSRDEPGTVRALAGRLNVASLTPAYLEATERLGVSLGGDSTSLVSVLRNAEVIAAVEQQVPVPTPDSFSAEGLHPTTAMHAAKKGKSVEMQHRPGAVTGFIVGSGRMSPVLKSSNAEATVSASSVAASAVSDRVSTPGLKQAVLYAGDGAVIGTLHSELSRVCRSEGKMAITMTRQAIDTAIEADGSVTVLNAADPVSGDTALLRCVRCGNVETAKAVYAAGGDPMIATMDGASIWHAAVACSSKDTGILSVRMIEWLATLDHAHPAEAAAAAASSSTEHDGRVSDLLEHDAGSTRRTALHRAAAAPSLSACLVVCHALVQAGAIPHVSALARVAHRATLSFKPADTTATSTTSIMASFYDCKALSDCVLSVFPSNDVAGAMSGSSADIPVVNIPAHRVVLSAASAYFHGLFCGAAATVDDEDATSTRDSTVAVRGYDEGVVRAALQAVYGCEGGGLQAKGLTSSRVERVAALADEWALSDLAKRAEAGLIKQVEPDTAADAFDFAVSTPSLAGLAWHSALLVISGDSSGSCHDSTTVQRALTWLHQHTATQS